MMGPHVRHLGRSSLSERLSRPRRHLGGVPTWPRHPRLKSRIRLRSIVGVILLLLAAGTLVANQSFDKTCAQPGPVSILTSPFIQIDWGVYRVASDGALTLEREIPEGSEFLGASCDESRMAYSVRTGEGSTVVTDAGTKTISSIPLPTNTVILNMAWSPREPSKLALLLNGKTGIRIVLLDTSTGSLRDLLSTRTHSTHYLLFWDSDGSGLFYDRRAFPEPYEPLNSISWAPAVSPHILRTFSTPTPASTSWRLIPPHSSFSGQHVDAVRDQSLRDRLVIPSSDGLHFVESTFGDVYVVNNRTGARSFVESAVLQRVLDSGVILFVDRYDLGYSSSSRVFVSWDGRERVLAAEPTTVHNLPLVTPRMTQGGAGYTDAGDPRDDCVADHTLAKAFAYDFQATGADVDVIASAEGTVVDIQDTVRCNYTSSTCDDYYPGKCTESTAENRDPTGFGNFVILQHGTPGAWKYSLYAHLSPGSASHLTFNQWVCQGFVIGNEGHTGNTCCNKNRCGDHLHYQLQKFVELGSDSERVDLNGDASKLTCDNSELRTHSISTYDCLFS